MSEAQYPRTLPLGSFLLPQPTSGGLVRVRQTKTLSGGESTFLKLISWLSIPLAVRLPSPWGVFQPYLFHEGGCYRGECSTPMVFNEGTKERRMVQNHEDAKRLPLIGVRNALASPAQNAKVGDIRR